MDFADFDRDGRVDVVAVSARPNLGYYYLSVLRGHGDGVFDMPPAVYLAGNGATDVVASDFNGDQWPDAATANSSGNSISVHLNAGNGTLFPRVEYGAGQQPRSLRAADFDGDGDKDIACLNCLSHDVSIFLNRGNGTFDPEIRAFVGNVTQLNELNPGPFLAIGDFDGDLDTDIAVPAGSRIKLLLNNGQAAFTLSPAVLSVPGTSYALVAADFDRDTRQDIAATVLTTSQAAVFRATGAGQFAPAVLYDVTNQPSPCPGCLYFPGTIAAGDLEGDGFPDLAVGHDTWWPFTVVLRNRRDGTFHPKELYQSDWDPLVVKLADVNQDGRDDLSVVNGITRSYMDVLLTSIAGHPMTYERFPFYDPQIAPAAEGRQSLAVGDLDKDGDQDLVVGMRNSNFPRSLRVIRNDAGKLVDLPVISLGPAGQVSIEDIAIGDVNGDGRLDIIAADAVVSGGFTDPGKVWVLLNRGPMAFDPRPLLLDGQFAKAVALGDLDQDQDLDLAVWTIDVYPGDDITPVNRRVLRFMNSGAGSFTPHGATVIDHAPWFPRGDVALSDVNGDGRLDIVASSGPRNIPGRVVIQRNQGATAFGPPEVTPVAAHAQGIALLPVDAGSGIDIAVAHNHNFQTPALNADAYLTFLFNSGSGSFPTRHELTNQSYLTVGSIAVAPDATPGQPKLVVTHIWGGVQVFLEGTSGLSLTSSFADTATWFSEGIVIADLNGDGRRDIAGVVPVQADGVVVLFNRSRGALPCYPNCEGLYTQPAALNARDFMCFINAFAVGDPYANCDGSTVPPTLTGNDFQCFLNKYAAACR